MMKMYTSCKGLAVWDFKIYGEMIFNCDFDDGSGDVMKLFSDVSLTLSSLLDSGC